MQYLLEVAVCHSSWFGDMSWCCGGWREIMLIAFAGGCCMPFFMVRWHVMVSWRLARDDAWNMFRYATTGSALILGEEADWRGVLWENCRFFFLSLVKAGVGIVWESLGRRAHGVAVQISYVCWLRAYQAVPLGRDPRVRFIRESAARPHRIEIWKIGLSIHRCFSPILENIGPKTYVIFSACFQVACTFQHQPHFFLERHPRDPTGAALPVAQYWRGGFWTSVRHTEPHQRRVILPETLLSKESIDINDDHRQGRTTLMFAEVQWMMHSSGKITMNKKTRKKINKTHTHTHTHTHSHTTTTTTTEQSQTKLGTWSDDFSLSGFCPAKLPMISWWIGPLNPRRPPRWSHSKTNVRLIFVRLISRKFTTIGPTIGWCKVNLKPNRRSLDSGRGLRKLPETIDRLT